MKTCNSCGAALYDQAVLCVHCGASQEALPAVDTVKYANICSNCGNVCHKDAIICVNCGQLLKNKGTSKKQHNVGKNVAIITIFFAIWQILLDSFQMSDIFYDRSYSDIEVFILYIISITSYVLILIGFIKGKNNKLPGVGFLLAAISAGLSLIHCLFDFSFVIEDVLLVSGYVINIFILIMIATMYLSKNDSVRKLWFVPVLSVILNCVLAIFCEYFDSYYFGFEDALIIVASYVSTLLTRLFACLNAKMNWSSKIKENNKKEVE